MDLKTSGFYPLQNESTWSGVDVEMPTYQPLSQNIAGPASPLATHAVDLATRDNANQRCLFRENVLDKCDQSRFYARALELYFLEDHSQNGLYRCLMRDCPALEFKTPKDMLLHLKHCPFFPQGRYWCPMCDDDDHSFRTRSKKRCSWNRGVNPFRKIFRKYFNQMTSTQNDDHNGLCANCKNPVSQVPQGFHSQEFPSIVNDPSDVKSRGAPGPASVYLVRPELSGTSVAAAELSGDITLDSSRYLQTPRFDELNWSPRQPSELSSESPNRTGTSSNVSPESPVLSPGYRLNNRPSLSNLHVENDGVHGEFTDGFDNTYYAFGQQVSSLPVDPSTVLQTIQSTAYLDPSGFVELPTTIMPSQIEDGSSSRRPNLTLNMAHVASHRTLSRILEVEHQGSGDSTVENLNDGNLNSQPSQEQLAFLSVDDNETLDASTNLADFAKPNITLRPAQIQGPSSYDTFNSGATPSFAYGYALDPSPSRSILSTSNTDTSPSSTSSLNNEVQCPHCDWRPRGITGNFPAYLRKHLRKHKPGPKLPCDHCGKEFGRQDNLTSHRRKIHSIHYAGSTRRRRSSNSLASASRSKKKGSLLDDGIKFHDTL